MTIQQAIKQFGSEIKNWGFGIQEKWKFELLKVRGAIVKQKGEWVVARDKPFGIILENGKDNNYRVYGNTKEEINQKLNQATKKVSNSKVSLKGKIDYYPEAYITTSKEIRDYASNCQKVREINNESIANLVREGDKPLDNISFNK